MTDLIQYDPDRLYRAIVLGELFIGMPPLSVGTSFFRRAKAPSPIAAIAMCPQVENEDIEISGIGPAYILSLLQLQRVLGTGACFLFDGGVTRGDMVSIWEYVRRVTLGRFDVLRSAKLDFPEGAFGRELEPVEAWTNRSLEALEELSDVFAGMKQAEDEGNVPEAEHVNHVLQCWESIKGGYNWWNDDKEEKELWTTRFTEHIPSKEFGMSENAARYAGFLPENLALTAALENESKVLYRLVNRPIWTKDRFGWHCEHDGKRTPTCTRKSIKRNGVTDSSEVYAPPRKTVWRKAPFGNRWYEETEPVVQQVATVRPLPSAFHGQLKGYNRNEEYRYFSFPIDLEDHIRSNTRQDG